MRYETYSLTIDEMRQIATNLQSRNSKREPIRISFYIASDEAQNYMLKMLEDQMDSRFIISVPNSEVLFSTVKSRLIDVTDMAQAGETIESICSHINGNLLLIKSNVAVYTGLALRYIAMNTKDRLKLKDIEDMLSKETVNGNKIKDGIHQFLISIIKELMSIYKTSPDKKEDIQKQIKQYNKLASQMMQPSASAKMIMDYVAYRLRV